MGGGGGDGGAAKRQAEAERKKQAARNQLNTMFGVAPDAAAIAATQAPASDGFAGQVAAKLAGRGPGWSQGGPVSQAAAPAPAPAAAAPMDDLAAKAAENAAAREALYGKVRTDAFTAGRRGIDEGGADAARRLKFALFDSGLAGGSVDVDENALLKRTQDRGLLDLGARADAASADLRGSDEQTRLSLLQAIDAGTDQGSALSSALNQMRVNSDKAAAAAQGTSVGDLFANAGLLYDRRLRELGKTTATRDYGNATRGSGSYQGTLSATGA
jgi:hypothetical protein